MENLAQFLAKHEVFAYLVGIMGIAGVAILVERVKTLYFDFGMNTEDFVRQIRALVANDKIEEAISYCSANEKKPIAYVVKRVLERSDRDERSMDSAYETAMSEIGPRINQNVGHVAMIANVATLIGLLATILGLIMSFKAVSFADPSQKQALLTQGISTAMYTTALGLAVAIPMMIAFAFLHARQNKIYSDLGTVMGKVSDALKDRHYTPFSEDRAYPSMKPETTPGHINTKSKAA